MIDWWTEVVAPGILSFVGTMAVGGLVLLTLRKVCALINSWKER